VGTRAVDVRVWARAENHRRASEGIRSWSRVRGSRTRSEAADRSACRVTSAMCRRRAAVGSPVSLPREFVAVRAPNDRSLNFQGAFPAHREDLAAFVARRFAGCAITVHRGERLTRSPGLLVAASDGEVELRLNPRCRARICPRGRAAGLDPDAVCAACRRSPKSSGARPPHLDAYARLPRRSPRTCSSRRRRSHEARPPGFDLPFRGALRSP